MGKLITLEGLDSSGKSSQAQLIIDYYKSKGKSAKFFHFPTYTHNEFGRLISSFLRGEFGNSDTVNPYFVANLYAMDRYLFKNELNEMIETHDCVVLDRYVLSNVAYQGAKYPVDSKESIDIMNWIRDLEFEFLKLPMFDLCVFLDVPIDTIEKRLNGERVGEDRSYLNGKQDIHESSLDLQKRVRHNYKKMTSFSNNYIQIECLDMLPNVIFESYKDLLD